MARSKTNDTAAATKTAGRRKPAAEAAAATTGAKVGKLDKGAKADKAPAKGKATQGQGQSGQQGQRAPRGQYADKKITLTAEGKAGNPRGNRGARWDIIKEAKNTNDVLGTQYKRADGEMGTITSAGLSNFVDRGWITLS